QEQRLLPLIRPENRFQALPPSKKLGFARVENLCHIKCHAQSRCTDWLDSPEGERDPHSIPLRFKPCRRMLRWTISPGRCVGDVRHRVDYHARAFADV